MVKKKTLIHTYCHEGAGYNPFLITPSWQVAQLNFQPENEFYQIQQMDVHYETDEVFILSEGTVVLITAEIENGKMGFELTKMESGIVYNVPANCWHNLMMSEDAKISIVENKNTHLSDFEFYYLSEQEKTILNTQVSEYMKNC